MARRYRRNPADQIASMLPLILAAGGIYVLARSVKPTAAGPVQGLGSIFSNVLKTVEHISKDTVVAPLQVAVRVAAAPIKLATGSSWSSVRNSIEAPGKSTVADLQSASPSSIRPQAQQQAAASAATTYLDANGNPITQQQYDGLMIAQGLQPAADIPGGTLQVPPAADADFTQSSNSVVADPSQQGTKARQGGAAPKSAVNPWMVGGAVVGVPVLMYFMHK